MRMNPSTARKNNKRPEEKTTPVVKGSTNPTFVHEQLERLRERKALHDKAAMGFFEEQLKASQKWLANFKEKPLTNNLLGWEMGDLIRHLHSVETMTTALEHLRENPERVEVYTRNFYARLVRSLLGGSWDSNTSLDTKVMVNKYESKEQGYWVQHLEYIVKTYENISNDNAALKEKYPEIAQELVVTKPDASGYITI